MVSVMVVVSLKRYGCGYRRLHHGVESYDINIEEQKVIVKGNVDPEAVFQTVSKTGKKTSFWEEASPAVEPETKPVESETKSEETEAKPAEAVAAQ